VAADETIEAVNLAIEQSCGREETEGHDKVSHTRITGGNKATIKAKTTGEKDCTNKQIL
jgi:hypothetical protein